MKKKKKRLKKKSKVKKFFLLIILITLIVGGFFVNNIISTYCDSAEKCLYVNNNLISFDCMEGYKYIHLKLSSNPEKHIKYNIINPKGQVVKTDELKGDSDFFCDGEKGMWKVTFEVNEQIKVKYNLWEGNLKFRDSIK